MNLIRALLEAIANKKPLKEVYQEIPQSLERHLGMIREALRKSPSPEFGEVEDDWDLFVEFTLGEFPHSVIIANFHDRDKDGEPKRFLAELGLTEDVSTIAPIKRGLKVTSFIAICYNNVSFNHCPDYKGTESKNMLKMAGKMASKPCHNRKRVAEKVSTIAPITRGLKDSIARCQKYQKPFQPLPRLKGTERTYEKEGRFEMNLTLDLPEELAIPLSVAGYDVEKLIEEAKRLLAVTLFQRHTLSLGQAAKLAEMHLWDFIQLLSQQGITIAEYDDAEIQQELESAEWLH